MSWKLARVVLWLIFAIGGSVFYIDALFFTHDRIQSLAAALIGIIGVLAFAWECINE